MPFFAIPVYGATLARTDFFLPTFLKMSEMYFIYFICLILSQTDTYTVICTNLEMKCFSITFQKIILKPFKQGI